MTNYNIYTVTAKNGWNDVNFQATFCERALALTIVRTLQKAWDVTDILVTSELTGEVLFKRDLVKQGKATDKEIDAIDAPIPDKSDDDDYDEAEFIKINRLCDYEDAADNLDLFGPCMYD